MGGRTRFAQLRGLNPATVRLGSDAVVYGEAASAHVFVRAFHPQIKKKRFYDFKDSSSPLSHVHSQSLDEAENKLMAQASRVSGVYRRKPESKVPVGSVAFSDFLCRPLHVPTRPAYNRYDR